MIKAGLYLVIGCVGLAAHPGRANADAPVRDLDERTLQEKYHIALTEEGLIGALQHPEGLVRSFAAIKLAENQDKNAIAPILAALAVDRKKAPESFWLPLRPNWARMRG